MIWTSNEKGDDKIIAYVNGVIYRGNPRSDKFAEAISELEQQLPVKNINGVPLSYIRQVNLQEQKSYIEVLYNKSSSEHLRVKDAVKRNEIFDYLAANIPGAIFTTEKYSVLKAGGKPLAALLLISLLFCWTLYLAIQIEAGTEYQVVGAGHTMSISHIALYLAGMGSTRLALLFCPLLLIAFAVFIIKARKLPVVKTITLRK